MCTFSLEKDEYTVNETAGVVRIGVVKTSGSVEAGQSVTVVVTPMQGTGSRGGAGTVTLQIRFHTYGYSSQNSAESLCTHKLSVLMVPLSLSSCYS